MENNVLLGATETESNDGSGVFNPNTPNADFDPSFVPAESNTESESEDSSSKNSTSPLLMYAGAALLLYFFVFKKK